MGIPTGAAWMQPPEPEGNGEGETPGVVVNHPASLPNPFTEKDRELLYAAIARVVDADTLTEDLDRAVNLWAKTGDAHAVMGEMIACARSAIARVRLLEDGIRKAADDLAGASTEVTEINRGR